MMGFLNLKAPSEQIALMGLYVTKGTKPHLIMIELGCAERIDTPQQHHATLTLLASAVLPVTHFQALINELTGRELRIQD